MLSLGPLIPILIGQVRSHLVTYTFCLLMGKLHSDTVGPETLQACCHIVQTWCAFFALIVANNPQYSSVHSDTFKCPTGNFCGNINWKSMHECLLKNCNITDRASRMMYFCRPNPGKLALSVPSCVGFMKEILVKWLKKVGRNIGLL